MIDAGTEPFTERVVRKIHAFVQEGKRGDKISLALLQEGYSVDVVRQGLLLSGFNLSQGDVCEDARSFQVSDESGWLLMSGECPMRCVHWDV